MKYYKYILPAVLTLIIFSCSHMDEKNYWTGNVILHINWEAVNLLENKKPSGVDDLYLSIYPKKEREVLSAVIESPTSILDIEEGSYDMLVLSGKEFLESEESFFTASLSLPTTVNEARERYITGKFSNPIYVGVGSAVDLDEKFQTESTIYMHNLLKEFSLQISVKDNFPYPVLSCQAEISGIATSVNLYNKQVDENSYAIFPIPMHQFTDGFLSKNSSVYKGNFYLIERSMNNFIRIILTTSDGTQYQNEIDISNHVVLSEEIIYSCSLECRWEIENTFSIVVSNDIIDEDNIHIKPE